MPIDYKCMYVVVGVDTKSDLAAPKTTIHKTTRMHVLYETRADGIFIVISG